MSQLMDVTFGNFMKKQGKTKEIKQKWGKNTKSQQMKPMGFNREEKTKRITDFFGGVKRLVNPGKSRKSPDVRVDFELSGGKIP